MFLGLCLGVLVVSQTGDGVLFQCQTNGARVMYLAGDFNGWAQNVGGRITNPEFAMSGPDTNGVWRKVVKLDPGTYRFKFNINGEPDGWFAPDTIDERDGDKNAIFRLGADGNVIIHSARSPKWKPQILEGSAPAEPQDGAPGGRALPRILFQFYAPDAHIVYLAGDFNNWANNRDGLTFEPQFAMDGPGANGIWRKTITVPPGKHLYQFVIDGDRWVADPNAEENDKENHSILVVK